MNPKAGFASFFGLVLAAFFFLWMALIVVPWAELGHLEPIRNDDDKTIVPWDKPNAAHRGEAIYASNGCAYCHTQQVRPETSGADMVRGWGTGGLDEKNKAIKRRTYPRDYIWQQQVFLGTSREGADLTNVGARMTSAPALYRYLYAPETVTARSSMPAYRFLFVTRKISGQPSADAVLLPPDKAAPAGYEVVPSPDGQALVAYLLSLKNDYHLPDEKGPVPAQPPVPKS